MVEKEFAPVTPGEMLKRNSWPSVACRKIHLRRRSESPQTESPRSSIIVGVSRPTLRCA